MNVKVEGGSTFGNVYVLPYIHCLLSERDGRWGGGGGGGRVLYSRFQVTGMIEWGLFFTQNLRGS